MGDFWTSKTFWFNLVALIVAVLANWGYTGELPEDWAIFVPVIITIINMILKWWAGTPDGQARNI